MVTFDSAVIARTKGAPDVTQFVVVRLPSVGHPDADLPLRPLPADETFIRDVARGHFADTDNCWVLDGAESVLDDVWEAQRDERELHATLFYRLIDFVSAADAELLCWAGSDFDNLPAVTTREDLEKEVRRQTSLQPAELYVFFAPSSRNSRAGALR
jgi:hypothetical protein